MSVRGIFRLLRTSWFSDECSQPTDRRHVIRESTASAETPAPSSGSVFVHDSLETPAVDISVKPSRTLTSERWQFIHQRCRCPAAFCDYRRAHCDCDKHKVLSLWSHLNCCQDKKTSTKNCRFCSEYSDLLNSLLTCRKRFDAVDEYWRYRSRTRIRRQSNKYLSTGDVSVASADNNTTADKIIADIDVSTEYQYRIKLVVCWHTIL